MNFIKLLKDHHIEYITEGNKHCTRGWVNLHCPFCEGSQNYHLGYDLTRDYYTCWRCGYHSTIEVIQKLTGTNKHEAYQILKQYGGKSSLPKSVHLQIKRKKLKYPYGTDVLQNNHKQYLEKRKFDPDKLQTIWGILGTGPTALLDNINFSHRILAPIYYQNKIVSYQARDITNKSKLKYLTCPKNREEIHHKHILYGLHKCRSKTVILVEGITDVWRLGPGAVACFGIGWKIQQQRLLVKNFQRIVIMFDNDSHAQKQAQALSAELSLKGKEVIQNTVQDDPATLNQKDADHLMRQFL